MLLGQRLTPGPMYHLTRAAPGFRSPPLITSAHDKPRPGHIRRQNDCAIRRLLLPVVIRPSPSMALSAHGFRDRVVAPIIANIPISGGPPLVAIQPAQVGRTRAKRIKKAVLFQVRPLRIAAPSRVTVAAPPGVGGNRKQQCCGDEACEQFAFVSMDTSRWLPRIAGDTALLTITIRIAAGYALTIVNSPRATVRLRAHFFRQRPGRVKVGS
jgi:hypothetical protein